MQTSCIPLLLTRPLRIGEDNVASVDVDITWQVGWLRIQSCFGRHFMVFILKRQTGFAAFAGLIGSKEDAGGFLYRLKLSGRDGKFLTWEGTPRGIREGVPSDVSNVFLFDPSAVEALAQYEPLKINRSSDENPPSVEFTIARSSVKRVTLVSSTIIMVPDETPKACPIRQCLIRGSSLKTARAA
ncbi:unnamed protein product [Darwinula stevensoni]|uniref:Seven-in-absentia protein TRAF-like domain-containing protein n=1 Tax=Darwinula stevensoni TaxID=69355 RepID=A0A7R9AAK6_9CRUS|nr:unnamed protein product [Darwinula stevensoni]CAG0898400.1 unnamed protein product [Darwinula stevensoni]